jgi:hypothetical protein
MPPNLHGSKFPIISSTNKQVDVYASEHMLITDAIIQGVSFISAHLNTAKWVALYVIVQHCGYERTNVKLDALY